MTKILIVDNYDSFTFNIVEYLRLCGYSDIIDHTNNKQIHIFRNDKITPQQALEFDKIILSPGPGIPDEAGYLKEIIKTCAPYKSILGICLGEQAIAEVFNAKLINLNTVYHGIALPVNIVDTDNYLFKNIPLRFNAGRYHSWVVDKDSMNNNIVITAIDDNGLIMGIKHKHFDVNGLQFHPESILTEYGLNIINNWVNHQH